MKNLKKRILSLVLACVMLINFNTISFAAGSGNSSVANNLETLSDGSYVLQYTNGYIKAYDLEDGNSVFEQYINGRMIGKYITNREQNTVKAFNYDSGESTTINLPRAITTPQSAIRGTISDRLGRIRFQYTTSSNAGICGAYVDYIQNTGTKKYNINGTYQNAATLMSYVASVLALPAGIAAPLVAKILTLLGIATGTASILIPNYELISVYEENEYTLTDMDLPSHKNTFFGTKYVITEAGSHLNEVYEEGYYYPTSSWGKQNFGTTIYNFLFYYSNWRIYAWN